MSVALAIACANPDVPYRPADAYFLDRMSPIPSSGPQIVQGRPNVVIDGVNHYFFSLLTKLLLWNWQVLDHRLPAVSRARLECYLRLNGLETVKVRHNQYAPIDELRRLRANRNVGAGYRYTFGIVSWLFYTLFPERLFAGLPLIGGGDHFNPFSNTINVYSSDPAILLHEGGHAKDYVPHGHRGGATILPRLIPGVDLIQEATASSDAIHFLQATRDSKLELEAYRTLYPAYSTYVAGYVPGSPLFALPVVVAGHAVGRSTASVRRSEIERDRYLASLAGIYEDALPEPVCYLSEP